MMKLSGSSVIIIIMLTAILSACASKRPALYPNYQLRAVGTETAQRDIDQCMQLAEEYGAKKNTMDGAAGETATNATVGAASGAAVGAIYDNAGQGAVAGAVGGTVSGMMRRLLNPREPDPPYRRFVERCLREKGYEPMDWH
jgi:hypothetical protein